MVDFPKLFDRNFIVGFFLPLAVFLATVSSFAEAIGVHVDTKGFVTANPFLSGFIVWLGAVFLLGINRQIVRTFEGYGKYNPVRLWKPIELGSFNRLHDRISRLEKDFFEAGTEEAKDRIRSERSKLLGVLAERFPESASLLLPTAFGNVLRAFEVYSREIYGFEAICGWSRLVAVVPKDYRELIDSAKAQVDFWLNLWSLSSLFFVVSLLIIYSLNAWRAIGFPISVIIIWWIASRCARSSAAQWGEMIKAAFDVFLPSLRKQLGFEKIMSRTEERAMWEEFSQVMTFRLRESLPEPSAADIKRVGFLNRLRSLLHFLAE
jgi:hypothetical protein